MPPRKLYGPQTELALRNFSISGWPMPREFLKVLALIKEHAAIVNGELGEIPKAHAWAIAVAARSIKGGNHLDQFPVDVFQTGSGTSTNMNMNEVIAALASGGRRVRGVQRVQRVQRVKVHPNDHVNRGQSSNDVIPTAMQIACSIKVRDVLLPALKHLHATLLRKGKEFERVTKTGRTHLMDAVPIRLGDEFQAYATLVSTAAARVQEAAWQLHVLPLGGTAVGTGLHAHPQFARRVILRLKKETHLPLSEAQDHIAAQSCPMAAQALGSALKEVAIVLTKVANDIRLMGSGPVAGFGELQLPELQPGSSIMPGKVNPVLCESVIQVAAWVRGMSTTVDVCLAQGSQFELHTCFPLLTSQLLLAMDLMANVSRLFAEKCIRGLMANVKAIADHLSRNAMLATALAPHVGYDRAAQIVQEAMRTGQTILEVAVRKTKIPRRKLERLLHSQNMLS